jgi:hypothetical protein
VAVETLVGWLLLSFVGVLQFLAIKYVNSFASKLTQLTEAGNRLITIVAVMQRDVDFLMGRVPKREADYFNLSGEKKP